MPDTPSPSLDLTLDVLRAAAEETRLRILALLAEGELSVSDLTDILGQSQPRISRHLKLLVEAGLVERHREGAWAFFRLTDRGAAAAHPAPDCWRASTAPIRSLLEDRTRLEAVRAQRSQAAQAFFSRLAPEWDRIRSLHAPEAVVEAAVLDALGDRPIRNLLDLGTGTGRMLQLLAPRASRDGRPRCQPRHAVGGPRQSGKGGPDAASSCARATSMRRRSRATPSTSSIIHQVLHYLDDPARALREAARLVAPGGRLLVVDFAPHDLEFLREAQAHRRLGFAADQVAGWLDEAGLDCTLNREIAPPEKGDEQLTVSLWLGQDRRVVTDWPLSEPDREVA